MAANTCLQRTRQLVAVASTVWAATALALSPAHAAGVWTNEPTGASVVLDCPFNGVSSCGILDAYSTSQIAADGAAPVSPSNTVKSTLLPGQTAGGMQLNYATPSVSREIYVGLMWRTNPQFQGRPVGNKLFLVRGPGSNGVFLFNASALVGGTGTMIFGHNTGGIDNSHTCSAELGALCFPNVGDGTLRVGTWTKLEAYIKASTTNTSRDGIVRWWINGVPVGNYTNLNYAAGGLNEWVWSETWDGMVNPPPTVEWNHFIDHLHVSIPNGGGSTDQPPGPPASPSIRAVTVP